MSHFNPVSEAVLQQLQAVVGKVNLSTTRAERQLHAQDMSHHPASLSEVVVWPTTAQQVADVLGIANEHRVPLRHGEQVLPLRAIRYRCMAASCYPWPGCLTSSKHMKMIFR